ncbi:MAG: C4-type zinc ribbon domain-containing protein [Planctomycetota bacterium]
MSLAVTADILRTLHRLHQQLADLKDRLAAGPRQLLARGKLLESSEAARAVIQDNIKKAKVLADQKQLQLKSDEAKILDLDSKLNACKTNREYQTLRDQIAAARMASKVLEDEILEALERIDTVKKTLPTAEAEVASIKKQLADTRSQIDGETATLEAEVTRISGDLTVAEAELPTDSLESYRRVAKSKGADSLASVEGESCGGCFQQITGNMVAELKMGKIIACRSCGRLLYLAK